MIPTERYAEKFRTLSLHNKIFFSILAVILIISLAIALLARGILVSSLTSELEQRGVAIAHSIADKATGFILDKDNASLVSLVFDTAQIGERRDLVSYIFVMDQQNAVLAHTFTRKFPEELRLANPLTKDQRSSLMLLSLKDEPAYDIAVPVKEGIYQVGTVHVGLNKKHIDQLIGKLRITFLGFVGAIFVIIFLISHRLSRSITSPISRLTKISDDLSRGNFDFKFDFTHGEEWHPNNCPAYANTDLPCWHFDQSVMAKDPEKLRTCRNCVFYKKRPGDEVVQLANSFNNMVWSIKLYRKQLRESEEKYRSLFDSGPDPIFVVDYHKLTILDANPRSEELYGYAKEELIGRPFTDLHPDYVETCHIRFEDQDAATSCAYCPKIIHYKKDNRPFYVNVHACPISYRGRQAIILAATDITEMIEKDAQLIQASKMKTLGEMSAGIAHELNQPLNAIKMGSEYLEMMVRQGGNIKLEQLLQIVTEISNQVDRSSEIINTLREFGRKGDFLKEDLDINKSIRGVLRMIGKQLALQNIEIRLDLDEDLRPIQAQNNRLQQVLFNLLTNARDAIIQREESGLGDGRRLIRIHSFNENGNVSVAVSDTGIGIPEAVKDKIFEPFFTTKQTGQGMGLGLSITYGIVKDYGGHIDIDSTYGEGTVFKLSFPVVNKA